MWPVHTRKKFLIRGGQTNIRKRIDRETKSKNKLTEPIGSVLVFVLYNSQFQFKFRFTKYKNHGFS